MRRPRMLMHAHMHRLQHKLGRSVAALGAGTAAYHAGKQAGSDQRTASSSGSSKRTQADHSRPDGQAAPEKESAWKRAGSAVGAVADTKDKIADTAGQLREQAKDLPVNAKYALYHGKTQVSEGVRDFTSSVTQTRTARAGTHRQKAADRPLQNAGRNWNRQNSRNRQLPNPPKGRLPSMNALLLQSSRKISDIMQIPLIQENQPCSQFPHTSGNGDRFLMWELWQNGLRFRW